ncbi:Sialic acid utilization regulator, RpiR family [Alkalibacterium sp. AK22]|uniref:MurR/RpiR family transcriptional regulator n=1 Tax=Alkalibacterium sp. AK22 TaxID=1229520 RepID=UPI0004534660|nr:MurR/RpiR family transcriptional regulator [Alkalibacterium sp. AK22]EXJ23128.1 Sialic acid utilization regulator, RpiR family [Alkalibacterium sp. AK22]
MELVTIRLKEYLNEATTTEEAIIGFILNNNESVSKMTIYKLAEATYTSPSSIIRLCKKCGFNGYKDFMKAFVYESAVRNNYKAKVINDVTKTDSVSEIVHKVSHKNILSLEETSDLQDASILAKATEKIIACQKLIFFGIGASLIVAKDAQLKFIRINKMAYVSEDWHTQLLMAKNMNKKDVGVFISYSGQTEEMLTCIKEAKNSGAQLISITKYAESPIANFADINLYVASNEYGFRSAAMSSRIAQLNLIDILYTAYLNKQYEQSIEILEKTQIKKGNYDDG